MGLQPVFVFQIASTQVQDLVLLNLMRLPCGHLYNYQGNCVFSFFFCQVMYFFPSMKLKAEVSLTLWSLQSINCLYRRPLLSVL